MIRAVSWLRAVLVFLFLLAALLLYRQVRLIRAMPAVPGTIDLPESGRSRLRPAPAFPLETYLRRIPPERFSFEGGGEAGGSAANRATGDFDTPAELRLAGTFLAYGGGRTGVDRLAVIEQTRKGTQRIVTIGEDFAGGVVEEIARDRLVVRRPDGSRLVFASFEEGAPRPAPPPVPEEAGALEEVVADTLAYQVSPFRRVINRDNVLALQERLLKNPEQLAEILGAVQPVEGAKGLEGYRVRSLRDNSLLNAFGLRPGDVIRKVNSVEMTSPKRAEYFYREFLRNDLTALVLEIERDGGTTNLIYSIQ